MAERKEAGYVVKDGVKYWLKDEKARGLIEECYSPSNPPPTNTWYATCGTSSGVGSKTATSATGDFVLATGAMVRVLFSNSNTAANPTISIDGSTAKNIRPTSGASGMDYMWKAGEVIDLVYDGSNFVMTKGGKADTSFYGITKLDSSTNSTATNVAATPKAVKDVKDMIPAASSATPQDLGTAAAGSSADYSRADHVHNKPTYTKGDVGLDNVDNVQQYSASNPPPYPVTSVNGQAGAVAIDKSSVGLGNVDDVQQYSASNPPPYPVTSVNGQTGAVSVGTTATSIKTLMTSNTTATVDFDDYDFLIFGCTNNGTRVYGTTVIPSAFLKSGVINSVYVYGGSTSYVAQFAVNNATGVITCTLVGSGIYGAIYGMSLE